MSFPNLYREIDEMLANTAKHTLAARKVVRKAGIELRAAPGAVVSGSLQWLIDLWYSRQTYNQPNNFRELEIGDDGVGPFSLNKMVPKKLSDEDFDITYMRDDVGTGLASLASYDIYECAPTFWGLGGEYPPGANFDAPPASLEDPGGTLDRLSSSYEVRPYVTGATSYDPFPYPEYPNYFWADFRHVQSLYIFYAAGPGPVVGPTVAVSVPTDEVGFEDGDMPRVTSFNSATGRWENFLWFGIKASLDGGETWEGPMANMESSVSDHYPPQGGINSQTFYYRENAEINLLDAFPGAYHPSHPTAATTGGIIKNKFRVDDVLCKFVVWNALTTERIYLTHWGVRGFNNWTNGDSRTLYFLA